jgi:hypothetical protein
MPLSHLRAPPQKGESQRKFCIEAPSVSSRTYFGLVSKILNNKKREKGRGNNPFVRRGHCQN